MPIYIYKCKSCNEIHEVIQRISDKALTDCPDCATLSSLEKQIALSAPPKFKGTGFYETDYKKHPRK